MQRPILLLLGLITFASCQVVNKDGNKSSVSKQEYTQTATSEVGVVTAAQPLATKAGVEMLEKGGNAVDAAVASAFALAVVEPSMSGLGGRLQVIVRLPDGGIYGIDATTQAPVTYNAATAPKGAYGYATIGIPGVVAGLTKLLEKHGSLPLKVVMAPAIQYAEEGYVMLSGESERHASEKNKLQKFSGSRQYFLKGDTANYKAGEVHVQKDLAQTLKAIAAGGRDSFYKGEIAKKMVADLQANGGVITLDDLANYEAKDAQILSSTYRDHDVHTLSMPSYGAITLEILNIMETLPLDALEDVDWVSNVYQAMELGYSDRERQTADSIPILISKQYAKKQAARIRGTAGPTGYKYRKVAEQPESWTAEMGHTTHLSTADSTGMMVALTQSLGPVMGSRVATPGLGFLYAVTLGGYLGEFKPGERASSHISPVIVTKEGKPFMALGAAGGAMIPTAVVSVISRVIDQQMPLTEALAAPRVHPGNDTLLLEINTGMGWKPESVEAIQTRGFRTKQIPQAGRFGRVHAIMYHFKTKELTGSADPDWEGAVGVPKKNVSSAK